MYAFDPDVVEYIGFGFDFMATSGLYGMLLAMHRCASVDLYGFQVSTEHGSLYHYYDVCGTAASTPRHFHGGDLLTAGPAPGRLALAPGRL